MARYAHINELKARLMGVKLDVLLDTRFGGSTVNLERQLTMDVEGAEAWVDQYTERDFTPLAKRMDVISGRGQPRLMLRHFPLVDVLQIDVKYDPLSLGHTFGSDSVRMDRESGVVSLKPSFVAQGPWPLVGSGDVYQNAFSRGMHNVIVQYRSGYIQVGDNIGLTSLANLGIERVGTITTSGSNKIFTCAEPYALCNEAELLSTRSPLCMLKDGVDDSANWTMVNSRQLSIATASYTATATYLFCYVPAPVGEATVNIAAASLLTHKGTKDHTGSAGGATSVSAGPFKEDYGEFQYAGQVKEMQAEAKALLQPYRRQV